MHKYDKMRRSHSKVRKYLMAQGFDQVFIIQHSRWQKDIFGLFDGFALKKSILGAIKFFQIKSNRKPPLAPYRKFQEEYGVACSVIIVKDRGGIEEW